MASVLVNSSVVSWSGAPHTTTRISATQLTASITSADIAAAGTAQVSGFNPVPGGGCLDRSNANHQRSQPNAHHYDCFQCHHGWSGLKPHGQRHGFVNGSVVNWNGWQND